MPYHVMYEFAFWHLVPPVGIHRIHRSGLAKLLICMYLTISVKFQEVLQLEGEAKFGA